MVIGEAKFEIKSSPVGIATLQEDLGKKTTTRICTSDSTYCVAMGTVCSLSGLSGKDTYIRQKNSASCAATSDSMHKARLHREGFPIASGTKTIYYLPHLRYQRCLLWNKREKKVIRHSMIPTRLSDFDVEPRWDFTSTAQSRIL